MPDPVSAAPPSNSPDRAPRGALGAAWKLGAVAGIGVYIHWTFPLLLIWIVAAALLQGAGAAGAMLSLLLIVAVFASVLLHELGHALTARRFGIPTLAITLLPIGGVSSLERTPDEPRHELAISLAGPAVSVLIAAAIAGGLRLAGQPIGPEAGMTLQGGLLVQLMWINLVVAAFNLLPAFPLDGGRVLRALLQFRYGRPRATRIAAFIGKGLAIALGMIGLFSSLLLVLVAIFVWIAATAEATAVLHHAELADLPIERAMITEFQSLAPDQPLRVAADLILAGYQDSFPVVDGDRVVGVLTRDDVLRGIARGGPEIPVAAEMRTEVVTVSPTARLGQALGLLDRASGDVLVVSAGGPPLGLITSENLGELLLVERALRARARATA